MSAVSGPKHGMLLLLLLALSAFLFGQSAATIDWEQGAVELRIDVPTPQFSPQERSRAYRKAESMLSDSFLSATGKLQIDSATTLSDWIVENPRELPDLTGRISATPLAASSYSAQFGSLSFRYRIPFFPTIAGPLLTHLRGYEPPQTLFFAPSARFSGILIYLKGELPLHGQEGSATARPALFPRIWDSEMNLLFESRMMDRETILRGGCVAYATSLNSEIVKERAGLNPIRILARGLFGIAPTDPIIPREDALTILNSPEGRRLLSEGKIVFVIEAP